MNNQTWKRVAVIVAVVAILGVGAFYGITTYAAGNIGANVGYVDMQQIASNSSDYKNAQETLAKAAETMQKEFETKSQGMNDAQKKQLFAQYQEQFNKTKQEELEKVKTKVDTAVKDVAAAQGITVVLDKDNVFFGGKDLTQDVINKLK